MNKILLFTFITVLILVNSSNAQYSSPESVVYDSLNSRYLVSNTNSSKITQRSASGVVTDFVNVGGSCHGLTIYNDNVYICRGTSVRGYKLSDASQIFNVTLTGSVFLNDITVDNATGLAYVSDFNGKRIYKLNLNTQQFWIYVNNIPQTPNGVYFDGANNRIMFCCWGSNAPVRAVSLTDSTLSTLASTTYSNCDGITVDKFGNVYVSSWGLQGVFRLDPGFSQPPVVVITGLSNPADIYVNKSMDTLASPNAGNNTVTFHRLNYPTGINNNSEVVTGYKLAQNYPNPFNPETVISYTIPAESKVSLKVFDLTGKEVAALINKVQNAGEYSISFNAANIPSGVYYYRIQAGNFADTRKMVVSK